MTGRKLVDKSKYPIKYFAMLHNAAALEGDKELEGGRGEQAIGYYVYLLNLDLPDIPKSFALPFEKNVMAEMQRFYETCLLIDNLAANKQLFTKAGIHNVIKRIAEQCDTYGYCYLPLGFRAVEAGHFLGVKVRKTADGKYAFSCINQGDGSEYHLQTSVSGTKLKNSYQSNEFLIDLNCDEGFEFFKYLVEVAHNPNIIEMEKSHINPYGSLDVYGLLKLSGEEQVLDLAEAQENKSVISQRSGTCPMTNTHAVARDVLVSNHADFNTRKRYHFILKLRSLIDGFARYNAGECSLPIFEWALNEFSVRLNKYYQNILSDEELLYCANLQNKMKIRINDDKANTIARNSRAVPLPEIENNIASFNKPDLESLESITVGSSKKSAGNTVLMDSLFSSATPVDQLKYAINMLMSPDYRSLDKIYLFLTNLPACTGENQDPYWDNMNTNDIATVIDQFVSIADYLNGITNDNISDEQKAKACLIALIMYDILAQLLPRMNEFKLGNEYTLGLDDIYSQQYHFNNPTDYFKIKKIANNFAKRAHGKKIIFSNVINREEDNPDKTMHYVLYVLNDEAFRLKLLEGVKKEHPGKKDSEVKDGELFEHCIRNYNSNILKLSSLAHHAGLSTNTYEAYTDVYGNTDEFRNRWCFTKTSYLAQILRKSERIPDHIKSDIKRANEIKYRFAHNEMTPAQFEERKGFFAYVDKEMLIKDATSKLFRLPDRNTFNNLDHHDYSENSIFIPYDKMQAMENASKHITSGLHRPFGARLTGSIHPWNEQRSFPWNIKPENLQNYIELNEHFRLLECSPHYQVIKALHWIKHNSKYLNDEIVRTRLDQLIFEYGKFDLAFATNPEETLLSIQSVYSMAKNILSEQENNMDACIWYLNLIQKLREHVMVCAAQYNFSLKDYQCLDIREILLNRIKLSNQIGNRAQLASILLADLDMTGVISIEETCQFLIARLLSSLGADPIPQQDVWIKHRKKIIDMLNGSDADQVINQFADALRKYQIADVSQLIWNKITERLISVDKNINIDLPLGALCDQRTLYIKKDATDLAFLHNKLLFAGLNLKNDGKFRLYSNGEYLESSDGRWRFKYKKDMSTNVINIKEVKQIITIDGHRIDFKLSNKFWKKKGKDDAYYHFWKSLFSDELILVNSILDNKAYLHSVDQSTFNILLNAEADGQFSTTDQVVLDLSKPSTNMEMEWAQRLEKIVDLNQTHCIAKYNAEKNALQMQFMQMLGLGIRFDVDKNSRFMSNEYPGYYLSNKISLPELSGYPNVLILQNDAGDLKVIIPAYALNKERENNTFHCDNVVKMGEYYFPDQHYFTYTLNKNGQLEGDSLVENMYLAILLRSLGDFKSAVTLLDKCRTHEMINARVIYLIYQIINRPLLSPLGAAFDLKLVAYFKEHASKWYKQKTIDANVPSISPEMRFMFKEHVKKISELYDNSYSHFKNEIAIHPSYLRLSRHEKQVLGRDEHLSTDAQPIEQDKRLELVSKYPEELVKHGFNRDLLPSANELSDYASLDFSTMRAAYNGSRPFDALIYLLAQFKNLLHDAVSGDPNPNKNMQLKRKLFFILQNQGPKSAVYQPDEKRLATFHGLIAVLLFINANRDKFKHFNSKIIASCDVDALINNALWMLNDDKERFKNQINHLIDFQVNPYQIKLEKPLNFDIERKTLHYDLKPITAEFVRPFEPLFGKYIRRKEVPVASAPFSLAEEEFSTLLEKNLFHRYKQGHEKNLKLTQPEYDNNKKSNLSDLVSELNDYVKRDKNALKALTDHILKMANKTPLTDENASDEQKAKAYYLMQQYESQQKHPLELSDIFVALLQKNPKLLSEQNPFLTQDDVKSIFTELSELACTQSRIDQANRILNIIKDKEQLKPFEVQEYSALLDQTRTYNVYDYPEFLVYEYAAGVMLRPDQVETLIQLIEYISNKKSQDEVRHALLQFAAGGGKTSVLIPVLAQRFANMGLLPVIINTSELYDIGLDQLPKSLKSSFKQQLEVIECELDYEWSTTELMKLHADLNLWLNDKDHLRCVLLKSVTWHSLNIARKAAYLEGDIERAKAAEAVLKFFKDKTIKLEDESQIVSDPMLQSIKTAGKQAPIPKHQLQSLQRFYDFIMGKEKSFYSIANLAGIINNRKTPILPNDLVDLQTQLADAIANDDSMAGVHKIELKEYLTKTDKKKPAWLVNLRKGTPEQKDLADRIVLARSFIKVHLSYILALQQNKDFGTSTHAGDLTAAPKHEGNDVFSHFGDYALLSALTIQMYEANGLTPEQIIILLERVITDSRKEREWNTSYNVPTVSEQWLRTVITDFNSYEDLTKDLINKIAHDPNYAMHPIFVKTFLDDYALPQIKVPLTRLTSTAAELQAGFNHSIMVSATPGLPEMYPAFIGAEKNNVFMDEAFEARVLDTLMQEKNKKHVILDMSVTTPAEFFSQFPTEELQTITTLIDRGALLTDFKAAEIIKAYFDIEKSKRASASAAFFATASGGRQKMHLKSQSPKVSEMEIDGAALISALKKQRIDPEEFMLFLFLDLSKTTGTDILRPYQDKAALTVGKGQTITETIQAAMRERRLLKKDAQTVTWVLFKSLYAQINKDSPLKFDPRMIMPWLIKNEAEKIEAKLKTRAYQGIDQALTEVVWAKVSSDPALYEKYKEFLVSTQSVSPYDIYEIESTKEKPDIVLKDYCDRFLAAVDLTYDSLPKATRERIEKIIRETSLLIEELDNPPKAQIGVEVEQTMQQEMHEETKTQTRERVKTRLDEFSEFSLALETYSSDSDLIPTIFNNHPDYKPLMLPNCEDIPLPKLLISAKHFAVSDHALKDKSLLTEMKPIQQLLIKIMPDNKFEYLACTSAGMEFYTQQLKETRFSEKYPAYAIVSTDGDMLSRTNNISIEKLQEIIETDSCQTMFAYANFLNGNIYRHDILAKLLLECNVTSYGKYLKLVDAIQKIHVSQQPISLLNIQQLGLYCGWFGEQVPIKSIDVKLSQKKDTPLAPYVDYPKLANIVSPLSRIEDYAPMTALDNDAVGKPITPSAISANQPQTEYKPI